MAQPGRADRRNENPALLERLSRALDAADPPPPELEATARGLLAWRTVDVELDALLGDAHAPTSTGEG
jgi:hypothetical protein